MFQMFNFNRFAIEFYYNFRISKFCLKKPAAPLSLETSATFYL